MILYELLAGAPPFDRTELERSGLEAMLRHIREVEPPRPSARLRASADLARSQASRVGGEPRRLVKLLSGDLDWITMKALEKEPSRRYATVRGLSRDVERYLDDEPTEASPPSQLYRLRKFVRRHRRGVAVGAAATVALAAFAVVMAVQAGIIDRARVRAEREAGKARAVNAYLQEMLVASDPWAGGERDITVLEALDRSVASIGATFTGQPLLEAAVRQTLGTTYAGLGHLDQAVVQLDSALVLRRASLGPDHPDVGETQRRRASVLRQETELDAAVAAGQDALRIARLSTSETSPTTVDALEALGRVYKEAGRHAEADSLTRRGLAALDGLPGDTRSRRADLLTLLASIAHRWRSDYAGADSLLAEAVALDRAVDPAGLEVATALNDRAIVKTYLEDYDAALELYGEALDIQRAALGDDHPEVAVTLENMGGVYFRQERYDEAIAQLHQVLDIRRRMLGEDHEAVARTTFNLAMCTLDSGDPEAALPLFRASVAGARRNLGADHIQTATMMHYLGEVLTDQGQLDEAIAIHEHVVAVGERVLAPENLDLSMMRYELGRAYLAHGNTAAAEVVLRQSYDVRLRELGEDSHRVRKTARLLAQICGGTGRDEEAGEFRRVAGGS
jgi:non-specific serine/threonine protein kinase/serine/threonine-protein kinase